VNTQREEEKLENTKEGERSFRVKQEDEEKGKLQGEASMAEAE